MKRLLTITAVASLLLLGACSSPGTSPTTSAPTTSAPSTDQATIDKMMVAGRDFYTSYQDCMNTPPAEAAGQVGEYCQSHAAGISTDFVQNLAAGGVAANNADPIWCAQTEPSSYEVSSAAIVSATSGTATVTAKFAAKDLQITLALIHLADGSILVDNVLCPNA